jgi:hypothetical protein
MLVPSIHLQMISVDVSLPGVFGIATESISLCWNMEFGGGFIREVAGPVNGGGK